MTTPKIRKSEFIEKLLCLDTIPDYNIEFKWDTKYSDDVNLIKYATYLFHNTKEYIIKIWKSNRKFFLQQYPVMKIVNNNPYSLWSHLTPEMKNIVYSKFWHLMNNFKKIFSEFIDIETDYKINISLSRNPTWNNKVITLTEDLIYVFFI